VRRDHCTKIAGIDRIAGFLSARRHWRLLEVYSPTMLAYLVRRLLYALPILIGVNLITFALFFVVNTPDDMARMQLGVKRVTPEAIERWKAERGYDKPLFFNAAASGARVTDTIFFSKSARMFAGDFGRAEDGRDIAREITTRMGPSLAIALPTFILGLLVTVSFALLLTFFRASYLDFWGVVLCVAMMSISGLFYIIGGQYLVSKIWKLVPISGYGGGLDAWKFLILPVVIGVVSGIGSSTRWYRTIFLEEISQGLCAHRARQGAVRTGRAFPSRPAQRDDSDPDRRRGRHPAALHGLAADRIVSSAFPGWAATPSTRSTRRILPSCARWCSSARCSTSSA
jgi:peptide/nickel transport system permease protein